jgi:hypothetical protein
MVEEIKMKIKTTLKECIESIKNYDDIYHEKTNVSVIVTSNNFKNNKRRTVMINPESDNYYDTLAMISYEDCIISDLCNYTTLNNGEKMNIIIVDLDRQNGGGENAS